MLNKLQQCIRMRELGRLLATKEPEACENVRTLLTSCHRHTYKIWHVLKEIFDVIVPYSAWKKEENLE